MKRNFMNRLLLLSLIQILFFPIIYADTCNMPFPQAVTYPYGIKPNNFTQEDMNQHCLDWFNKWRAKYVTQNNCTGAEWRLQRTETGNMISKGCSENDTVSEGIGYGMVIMVFMSSATNNTKQYFDGMYTYFKNHLDGSGLMNWQIPYCDSGGSATDADEDVAFALLAADKQWGSAGAINYHNEALTIIERVLGAEINSTNDVRPGDGWDGGNISYFAPYEYRMFGDYTGTGRWFTVASHTYSTIVNYYYTSASTNNADLGIKTGLQPNWCNYDGTTWSPGAWAMDANSWWWDAIRHVWRQSYDYILYGTQNHQLAYDNNARVSYFFKTKYAGDASQIKSHYKLDGTETSYNRGDRTPDLGTEDVRNLPGPEGAVAISAMVEGDQTWLNECYYTLVTMNAGTGSGELTDTGVAWGTDYFCDILKMQYLLILTGNMPNPMGNYPSPTPTNTWDTRTPTPTPVPKGMFDDFETGSIVNLDTAAGGQSAFTSVTNATDKPQAGSRSIKIVSTASSWGAYGQDSPYTGGLGYRDYTGATTLDFDIYSTAAITFFVEIKEGTVNGADGEMFSNRGSQSTAAANGWRHISIPITNTSVFNRDSYSAIKLNNVLDLGSITSFYMQIDSAPNATIWIDNIIFTGSFPADTPTFTVTKTRTPFGSPTNTRTATQTFTNTPFFSPTITPTNTLFISPTNSSTYTATRTATITPTFTLTPNMPFGVFDDFETGVLKNPSTIDTGGGSTLTIANEGTTVHAGTRAMSAVMTGTGWAVASIDSPYDGGLGYKDFTGATAITFWINAPASTGYFLKIAETNGQQWSNRNPGSTTGAAGWQQVTLALSAFAIDDYSPAGDGDAVFDKDIIKSVQFQWDNSGDKTVYLDDITFTGMPVPSATASPSRTQTSTKTPSSTVTPFYSPTVSCTVTGTITRTGTATYTDTVIINSETYTPTLTATYTFSFTKTVTSTNTKIFTETVTQTFSVTNTHTVSPTWTISPTGTPPTHTITPTDTVTPTSSKSATCTYTNTPVDTATNTPVNTPTFTVTLTPKNTFTLTVTRTSSITTTNTASPTGTPPTPTVTQTITETVTSTSTLTTTLSVTLTVTYTHPPADTAVNTPVNTFTKTAVFTQTQVSSITAIPTATITLTAGLVTPTITPTAAKEPRFLEITDPIVYPCPYNPKFGTDLKIKIKLNKACSTLKLKIYTAAYRRIFEATFTGNFNGDTLLTADADNFKMLSNGTYYYTVTGEIPGSIDVSSKIKAMIIIRFGG